MHHLFDVALRTLGSGRGPGARRWLPVLLAGLFATGCSWYAWNAPKSWAFKGQLQSVAESAPHGDLTLERNSYKIFLLVDGKAAFREDVRGTSATFHLTPGKHEVVAIYNSTEGNSAVVAGPLKTSVDIANGQRVALGVAFNGSLRFVRP